MLGIADYTSLLRIAPGFRARGITGITAVDCLVLCAFAQAVGAQVRAHRRIARGLGRLAGVFLIDFGIRLGTQ